MNESPVIFRWLNFLCLGFFSFLKFQAGRFCSLSHSLSTVALASGIVHPFFDGHGFVPGWIFLIQIHILFRLYGPIG